jgi:predicted  nucleic acid-binding Zn-ribbon protein
MSTIGKIFLVLNLVLAGAFVGYSALSVGRAEELKKAHADAMSTAQAEKAKVDKDLADARAQLNTERTAKDEATSAKNSLAAEKTRLEADLQNARDENTRNSATLKQLTESVAEFSGKLEKLDQEKTAALAAKEDANLKAHEAASKAEDAENARRAAEEAKTRTDRDVAELRKALASSNRERESLQNKIDSLVAFTGVNASDVAAQPEVSASVTQVDSKDGAVLVQFGVGKDKVKIGYVFDVWKGATWKGQVRIDQVYANSCAGTVIHANAGTKIERGDSASTRL